MKGLEIIGIIIGLFMALELIVKMWAMNSDDPKKASSSDTSPDVSSAHCGDQACGGGDGSDGGD